jgi:hypothetical protein
VDQEPEIVAWRPEVCVDTVSEGVLYRWVPMVGVLFDSGLVDDGGTVGADGGQ